MNLISCDNSGGKKASSSLTMKTLSWKSEVIMLKIYCLEDCLQEIVNEIIIEIFEVVVLLWCVHGCENFEGRKNRLAPFVSRPHVYRVVSGVCIENFVALL